MVEYYVHNELGDTNQKVVNVTNCIAISHNEVTSIHNHIDASIHEYVVQN
jgi:hypothetical protein